MTRTRLTLTTLVLPLVLLSVIAKDAHATSFAQALINDLSSTPPEDNGTTSASVTSGGNSASAFVNPVAETMGAFVASDGSVISVSASSGHSDDWCFPAACDVPPGAVHVLASIGFDAVVGGRLVAGGEEFSLEATYSFGGHLVAFDASEDSSPLSAGASFDGDPIAVSVVTDSAGNVHVSGTFVRTVLFTPSSCVDCPLFSDNLQIQLEMEGSGFVDASHTFTVTLTPLDPGTVLTSTDGRTIGSAPAAEPVPEPASLLLLGAGLIPLSRRLRRR
jgi:PEP-CTERM motif-containing protein